MKKVLLIILLIFIFVVVLILLPYLFDSKDTYANEIKYDLKMINSAIVEFHSKTGRYPTNEEGIEILTDQNNQAGKVYFKRIPSDPWGVKYNYKYPGDHNTNSYDIWTFGSDGKAGGKGNKEDIGNW